MSAPSPPRQRRQDSRETSWSPAPSRASPRPPPWCADTDVGAGGARRHHHLALQRTGLSGLWRRDRQAAIFSAGFDLVLGIKDVGSPSIAGEGSTPRCRSRACCATLPRCHCEWRCRKDWSAIARVAAPGQSWSLAITITHNKTDARKIHPRQSRFRPGRIRATVTRAIIATVMVALASVWRLTGARRRSHQDRILDAVHRRSRLERKGDPRRLSDVGAGHQRQGRVDRPARSGSSTTTTRAILRGTRRSMPNCSISTRSTSSLQVTARILSVPSMPVVIPITRAARAVRARREQRVQLPVLFLDVPGGARCGARVLARLFRDRQGAETRRPSRSSGADSDFAKKAADGARENADQGGLQDRLRSQLSAQDRRFHAGDPPRHQATNPDFVYVASYPTESVGMVRAANEIGLKTKLFGGGMVGRSTRPSRLSSASC